MSELPNVVLLHGAWADGSSWSAVIRALQAKGYNVTAPQLPETSLADDVAAPQLEVERDIGVGAALEVFQIGKRAGGFERVVDDDVRRHRRDLVVDRRQFVVFDLDQLRGVFGDVRIARQHGGDRLADMVHLVERQDRLIVKRRTVIGLRDQLADILAGDDAMHAGDGLCGARVDGADAAVRHR